MGKAELNPDLQEILANDTDENASQNKQNPDLQKILANHMGEEETQDRELIQEYAPLFRGEALNLEELYQLSADEDVNIVYITGPHGSGKTTLAVMMYRLFLEGKNKELFFAGSKSLNGFKSRMRKMMHTSGEAKAKTDRTPWQAQDCFLHLCIRDKMSGRYNLLLMDKSGEHYENDRFDDICFTPKNVMIIIDGDKMSCNSNWSCIETEVMIKIRTMIAKKIIKKKTKVQIICSKGDKIKQKNMEAEADMRLASLRRQLEQFESCVYQINILKLSALNIEDEKEREKLESVILKCLEPILYESDMETNDDFMDAVYARNYEKYAVRG